MLPLGNEIKDETVYEKKSVEIKSPPVFLPPKPIVSTKIKTPDKPAKPKDYTDYEYESKDPSSMFGNVEISVNADDDSVVGKLLQFADKVQEMKENSPPIMETIFNVAKNFNSMKDKFNKINKKIENTKLKDVQGYVNKETDNVVDSSEGNVIKDPPLGPEARQNHNFEKQMQSGPKKTSLLRSIFKNVGPLVMSEIAKNAAGEPGDDGGPSIVENFFVNVGPKIIAESFGNGDSSSNDNKEGGISNGIGGALSLLTPFVKTIVEKQGGDKENVNTAVDSIMGVLGGMAPLLQQKEGESNGVQGTLDVLKPVLSAMGPSIMDKILSSKQNQLPSREKRKDKNMPEAEESNKQTFVDQMLHGMDEKTVGKVIIDAILSFRHRIFFSA